MVHRRERQRIVEIDTSRTVKGADDTTNDIVLEKHNCVQWTHELTKPQQEALSKVIEQFPYFTKTMRLNTVP